MVHTLTSASSYVVVWSGGDAGGVSRETAAIGISKHY